MSILFTYYLRLYYINLLIKVLFIYLLLTFIQPINPYIYNKYEIQNKFCGKHFAIFKEIYKFYKKLYIISYIIF